MGTDDSMSTRERLQFLAVMLVATTFVGLVALLFVCLLPGTTLDSHLYQLAPSVDSWAKHYELSGPGTPRFVHFRTLSMLIDKRLKEVGFIVEGGKRNTNDVIKDKREFMEKMEEALGKVSKRVNELESSSSLDESMNKESYAGELKDLKGIKKHMEVTLTMYELEPATADIHPPQ